jgi:hypothetical protein
VREEGETALARLRQDRAISDIIRAVKANSSNWLQKQLKDLPDRVWQTGYSAFTVSAAQCPAVREHINNQKQHHGDMTYDVELPRLLRKHEIEFDERDLWE